jgi:phosphoribosyl-ATP pyrophosphohydrolase/phosphoribosyl-AMP cyclohydrolase/histidinol dehydrogenase
MSTLLPTRTVKEIASRERVPVDVETLARAAAIVGSVQQEGFAALRRHAEALDGLAPGAPLVHERPALERALAKLPVPRRELLERTAARIERFAAAQRDCLAPLDLPLDAAAPAGPGRIGHGVVPVERAGCYAPGGRYPYPSSVLMTAVTARAAGVAEVWVAAPRPAPEVLAAAAVAGADAVLAAGGAQAVAALAHGAGPVPRCDAIVGPGNRWVTAGKQLVAGLVRIDALAGPSELVVVADGSADPRRVALDLFAQAEHDPEALPVLVALDRELVPAVRAALAVELDRLPTAPTARAALAGGASLVVEDRDAARSVCCHLAPEHLQLDLRDPGPLEPWLATCAALFVGPGGAEVFGDYGAGPNHVLPTGGTARAFAGLSVLTFLKLPTYVAAPLDALPPRLVADAAELADVERLAGHAAAARARER